MFTHMFLYFFIEMETVNASIPDIKADPKYLDGNGNDVKDFGQRVDDMFMKVDQVSKLKQHCII